MKEFVVRKNENGMRLQKYAEKILLSAPQSEIYKSLRKKKIKVNGKRVTDGKTVLCTGDVIEMYINDEFFDGEKEFYIWQNLPPEIDTVYEDEHIIILSKPSGMLSQSDMEDSLEGRMRAYLLQTGEFDAEHASVFVPSLCHRIDRNTEGLVIAAKDAESLKIIGQKIRDKEIKKFYLCRLVKSPKEPEGTLVGYIKKDAKRQRMVFSEQETPGSVFCETKYKVWSENGEVFARVQLLTGRTHQIRASFAALGCPLAGDVKYGAPKDGKSGYQSLRAYKLVFDFAKESGILGYLNGKVFEI